MPPVDSTLTHSFYTWIEVVIHYNKKVNGVCTLTAFHEFKAYVVIQLHRGLKFFPTQQSPSKLEPGTGLGRKHITSVMVNCIY